MRTCKQCGKRLKKVQPKFCSLSCSAKHQPRYKYVPCAARGCKRRAKVVIRFKTGICKKCQKVNCKECGKLFLPKPQTSGLHCSRSCGARYSNVSKPRKKPKYCANSVCQNTLKTHAYTYCSQACHNVVKYSTFITTWKVSGHDPRAIRGTISSHVRTYIWSKYQSKCAKCGWNKKHKLTGKPPLEIDHISGDWSDGSEANLWLLCPNCHAMQPTYKNHNNGHGRSTRRITARKRYTEKGMTN